MCILCIFINYIYIELIGCMHMNINTNLFINIYFVYLYTKRERENIYREICYKRVVHMIVEANKSQDLQNESAIWRQKSQWF